MTDHPITPPPELVQQWAKDRALLGDDTPLHVYIATRAFQAGADMELEACCELMDRDFMAGPSDLRNARRPKPPSLKKQALEMLENAWEYGDINNNAAQTIRRALEALPD